MKPLTGKTVFISGASRGIGHAIGLRCAADGANVVVAAKTTEPHPKLPGTIYTAAEDMERAGGRALAIAMDIRMEDQVTAAIERTVATFGGLDILVNNASAIHLTGTVDTPMKRFDLMFSVNVRGTFACSQAAIPHLAGALNPHILNLSPPLNLEPRWFAPHCAYTMSKYGMSLCVLGMAEELAGQGIAVNALWPQTTIATAATAMIGGGTEFFKGCRRPEIMADAAYAILTRSSRACTGNFFIDEQVLAEEGVTDLDRYAVEPGHALFKDFFVD
ncbi:MAG TPA: NAD(P)-dependent oxidoreductase [Thermoanaerobaculia bacterium]|nr:NAD(P)-dependent oxidoreductase [Thermoanaerobaculia bacterium]